MGEKAAHVWVVRAVPPFINSHLPLENSPCAILKEQNHFSAKLSSKINKGEKERAVQSVLIFICCFRFS